MEFEDLHMSKGLIFLGKMPCTTRLPHGQLRIAPSKKAVPKKDEKITKSMGGAIDFQLEGLVFCSTENWVVVSNIFLMFTPNPGEMIQFDEHTFQMGWFNHQLEYIETGFERWKPKRVVGGVHVDASKGPFSHGYVDFLLVHFPSMLRRPQELDTQVNVN